MGFSKRKKPTKRVAGGSPAARRDGEAREDSASLGAAFDSAATAPLRPVSKRSRDEGRATGGVAAGAAASGAGLAPEGGSRAEAAPTDSLNAGRAGSSPADAAAAEQPKARPAEKRRAPVKRKRGDSPSTSELAEQAARAEEEEAPEVSAFVAAFDSDEFRQLGSSLVGDDPAEPADDRSDGEEGATSPVREGEGAGGGKGAPSDGADAAEEGAAKGEDASKPKRRKGGRRAGASRARRVAGIAASAAAIVVIVLFALFAWDRWLRYDDAADIVGTWQAEGGANAVVVTSAEIELAPDATFSYEIDPFSKTITYAIGNMEGEGRYRFSADRNSLAIMDGPQSWFAALVDDMALGIQTAWAQLTGGEAPALAAGDGAIVLDRSSSGEESAAGDAGAADAGAGDAGAAGDAAAAEDAAATDTAGDSAADAAEDAAGEDAAAAEDPRLEDILVDDGSTTVGE